MNVSPRWLYHCSLSYCLPSSNSNRRLLPTGLPLLDVLLIGSVHTATLGCPSMKEINVTRAKPKCFCLASLFTAIAAHVDDTHRFLSLNMDLRKCVTMVESRSLQLNVVPELRGFMWYSVACNKRTRLLYSQSEDTMCWPETWVAWWEGSLRARRSQVWSLGRPWVPICVEFECSLSLCGLGQIWPPRIAHRCEWFMPCT